MHIKICGLTNLEDALLATSLGADALGFIFYEKSGRFISPQEVRKITDQLPAQVKKVGVFVNPPPELLSEYIAVSGINAIQLHGSETPEFCQKQEVEVIKCINLINEESVLLPKQYPTVQTFLVDAFDEHSRGGTGKRADWRLARKVAEQYSIFLAGGLTPENVVHAVESVRPFGVDVSSGVEESVGKKSPSKMRRFVKALRGKTK